MTTSEVETVIEYALMVAWKDGSSEFVPAKDAHHAEEMARKLYAHCATWTVAREVLPWRYVRVADAVLTDQQISPLRAGS